MDAHYTIQPMDYGRRNDMQCVWVGLAAVLVVYVLMAPSTRNMPYVTTARGSITGFLAAVTKAIPSDTVTLDSDAKEKNHETLKRHIAKEDTKALIVVYADWCQHCKTTKDYLKELRASGALNGITVILVNGEKMHPECFTGENATIPNMTHYPYVLAKDGPHITTSNGVDDALATLRKPATSANVAPIEEEMEEEVEQHVNWSELF